MNPNMQTVMAALQKEIILVRTFSKLQYSSVISIQNETSAMKTSNLKQQNKQKHIYVYFG